MKSEVFQHKYKKLNRKQREAVDTIEGPVMVIAGPGTGKTTILTLRIANILRITDTPPSGILALTFTDAGVQSMRMKLREVIGGRADEVRIHTFHGFAASIISEYRDHFIHLDGTTQMTDVESEVILQKILENDKFSGLRPNGKPDFYINSILKTISEAKRDALTPEMIKSFAKETIETIQNSPESISNRGVSKGGLRADVKKMIEKLEKTIVFSDIYLEYENEKIKALKIDYDDLIFELLIALRSDRLLLRQLQEKFLYILVDEHQDSNGAQNEIIRLLAKFFDTPNVFIVGDEKQAIYRFQGASVSNFLQFEKMWKEMKVIALKDNYRSDENILNASFQMIENNYNNDEHLQLRIKLKGNTGRVEPVSVFITEDTNSGERSVAEEISKIQKNNPNSTVAVIVRKNAEVLSILETLHDYGLNAVSERSIDIFTHPVGIIFLSVLEFVSDSSRLDLLAKTVSAGLWGLKFSEEVDVIKAIRGDDYAKVEKLIPAIKYLKKELMSDRPVHFVIKLAKESGLEAKIANKPEMVEVWRALVTFIESIVKEKEIQSLDILVQVLLSYQSASRHNIKVPIGDPDAKIRVQTAHSSKGLEFDYVFIPYATEESWISRYRGDFFVIPTSSRDDEEILRDTRRLFYVALTRAKKGVYIVTPKKDKDGKLLNPVRFVDELDKDSVSTRYLSNVPIKNNVSTKNFRADKNVINYTKAVLIETGLSVTAINHFIDCPNKFIFKSILKIPEIPNINTEKGNAMHKSVDNIWKSKKRDMKSIESIIKQTVTKYIEKSSLRTFEKQIVLKELLKNIKPVTSSLSSHFRTEGEVMSEKWVEMAFDTSYKGQKIVVPLHGKLDAVILQPNQTLVYDYKTRGNMSENEIRGETLTKVKGKGDYFRQLVFYKYLLGGSEMGKQKMIIPSLVFLTPDKKGNCHIKSLNITSGDQDSLKQEISTLLESVWSGNIGRSKCDDEECEYCKLRSL